MKKVLLGLAFAAFASMSASAAVITQIDTVGKGVFSTTASTITLSNPITLQGCTDNLLNTCTYPLSSGQVLSFAAGQAFSWVFAPAQGTVNFTATSVAGSTAAGDVTWFGTFTGLNTTIPTGSAQGTVQLTWQANGVNPSFSLTATTVPEPGSMALLGSGLVGLGLLARRRRK